MLLRSRDHATVPDRRGAPWESQLREWYVDGLAVGPEHRMVGHTGFMLTARAGRGGQAAAAAAARQGRSRAGTDSEQRQ